MFKNRKVEMKVKDSEERDLRPETTLEEKTAAAQAIVKIVIKEGGKVLVAYVALDTFRKFILIGLTNQA
jgi:hypothetical protein